jgi:predicted Zn-dependent peptidase
MQQEVYQHTFSNGLTLLAERMDHVRSAALNFLVPAGCVYDDPAHAGVATVLAELITRGAGARDSEELTLALDNLGLDRSESVGLMHTRFWGATVASNMAPALELYADILRRPHLPEDELDPVKALALQDLRSLEDEPRSKCLTALRQQNFPPPLSNDHRGTVEGLGAITSDHVGRQHRRLFRPNGTILTVAGSSETGQRARSRN